MLCRQCSGFQQGLKNFFKTRSPSCAERFSESATTDTTGTFGMHIWLINQTPRPYKLPPYDTHAHMRMLTHSLMLGKGDSCCQNLQFTGKGGGPRDMGRH